MKINILTSTTGARDSTFSGLCFHTSFFLSKTRLPRGALPFCYAVLSHFLVRDEPAACCSAVRAEQSIAKRKSVRQGLNVGVREMLLFVNLQPWVLQTFRQFLSDNLSYMIYI